MKINFRLSASNLCAKETQVEQKKFGMSCTFSECENNTNFCALDFGLEYAYSDRHKQEMEKLVYSALRKVCKLQIQSSQKILFIGVGNPNFTADCFGVCVSKRINSKLFLFNQTKSSKLKFYYFNPDIRAKTGLNTINLTNLVIDEISPDIIFLFDCYATKHAKRVGRVIEVKNKALSPASAVEGYDDAIKAKGAKIISIGAVLLKVSKNNQMLSMRTNSDLLTSRLSEIVCNAVCRLLEDL